MTEEWICPYCGYENENTERIALKEICKRCENERTTPGCLEQEIHDKLEELDSEKFDIIEKMEDADYKISLLKPEFRSDKEKERAELVKKYHEIEMKQINLKGKTIYSEKIRRIYKDQKQISDFK